jgi:hypothetical protein
MSFGPKLEDLGIVQPGRELVVTLTFTPSKDHPVQDGVIFVEDWTGIRSLAIRVSCVSASDAERGVVDGGQ